MKAIEKQFISPVCAGQVGAIFDRFGGINGSSSMRSKCKLLSSHIAQAAVGLISRRRRRRCPFVLALIVVSAGSQT